MPENPYTSTLSHDIPTPAGDAATKRTPSKLRSIAYWLVCLVPSLLFVLFTIGRPILKTAQWIIAENGWADNSYFVLSYRIQDTMLLGMFLYWILGAFLAVKLGRYIRVRTGLNLAPVFVGLLICSSVRITCLVFRLIEGKVSGPWW